MILEIFKDSFEYSFKDPESILKLGVLSIFSVFIIPIFFVTGYSYRITDIGIKGTINGNDPLPEYKNWSNMFIQGLKVAIVRFVYLLPGIILFLIFHERDHIFNDATNISLLGPYIGILALTIIVWLIFYLFSIVAIPNMINEGSLKSAFNIKKLIKIIKSVGFFRYVKFYLGCIVLIVGILGTLLILISLIGLSIAFLIKFMGTFAFYITSIFIIGIFVIIAIMFLLPFFLTFESRAIGLIYNMRELE